MKVQVFFTGKSRDFSRVTFHWFISMNPPPSFYILFTDDVPRYLWFSQFEIEHDGMKSFAPCGSVCVTSLTVRGLLLFTVKRGSEVGSVSNTGMDGASSRLHIRLKQQSKSQHFYNLEPQCLLQPFLCFSFVSCEHIRGTARKLLPWRK